MFKIASGTSSSLPPSPLPILSHTLSQKHTCTQNAKLNSYDEVEVQESGISKLEQRRYTYARTHARTLRLSLARSLASPALSCSLLPSSLAFSLRLISRHSLGLAAWISRNTVYGPSMKAPEWKRTKPAGHFYHLA